MIIYHCVGCGLGEKKRPFPCLFIDPYQTFEPHKKKFKWRHCPYGSRAKFVHIDEKEAKKLIMEYFKLFNEDTSANTLDDDNHESLDSWIYIPPT